MNKPAIIAKLFEIIEPVAEDAGFEVVDIAFVTEGVGPVVRVFLDSLPPELPPELLPELLPKRRPNDGVDASAATPDRGIGLADCERMSRELSAVLDVEDPVPCAYSLEVSSPGIDRPLRTAAHFERHVGEQAKARLNKGLDGRRNFTGTIAKSDESAVCLVVDGTEFSLPLADIASAKLVPDWDALMAGRGSRNKNSRRTASGSENQSNTSGGDSSRPAAK